MSPVTLVEMPPLIVTEPDAVSEMAASEMAEGAEDKAAWAAFSLPFLLNAMGYLYLVCQILLITSPEGYLLWSGGKVGC